MIRRRSFTLLPTLGPFVGLLVLAWAGVEAAPPPAPKWAFNATSIEACSCPMFCQCFFNTQPAGHHDHPGGMGDHYCRANLAHRVNHGYYGGVELDGARFWEAADLGGDFTKGFDWMVLHFDPSVTSPQREAILEIYRHHIKPLEFRSFRIGEDAPIEWTAGGERSVARLGGGKLGEVVLRRNPGMTVAPFLISNLKYFAAPRNDGFVLMPNDVEAYRLGDRAFEYRGTNGFMITYDATSADFPAAAK